jgi:hypothetical protein
MASVKRKVNRPEKKDVERVSRMYRTNSDAGRALGVSTNTYRRWCTHYSVDTADVRRR